MKRLRGAFYADATAKRLWRECLEAWPFRRALLEEIRAATRAEEQGRQQLALALLRELEAEALWRWGQVPL